MEQQYKFTISVDVIAEDDVEAWWQVVESLNDMIDRSQGKRESTLGFDGNSMEMTIARDGSSWYEPEWKVTRKIVDREIAR